MYSPKPIFPEQYRIPFPATHSSGPQWPMMLDAICPEPSCTLSTSSSAAASGPAVDGALSHTCEASGCWAWKARTTSSAS